MDYDNGNIAVLTLAHNATLTFQDVPDFGEGIVEVTQDATGSRTLAFAENIVAVTTLDEGIVSDIQPDATTTTLVHYHRKGNSSTLYVTVEWR